MITDLIFEYLKARAEFLNETFELDQINDLELLFVAGFRTFHGVQVNEKCFPLWDDREPIEQRGLLNAFINYFITTNFIPVNHKKIN
jgi:hypothetical protein